MEIDHVFHRDHKLVYKQKMKRCDESVVCAACLDEISAQHYSCEQCNFFLHKSCAERPLELTHSMHPLHPLRLLPKSPYDGGKFECSSCVKVLEGFVYHCAICKFDLDFICAFPDGLKMHHACHPSHVLTCENVVKRNDKGVVCAACLEQILGPLTCYYSCRKCNFFLHELCFQRPLTLTSSLHPQHPLDLLPRDPHKPGLGFCRACHKAMKGFVYDCSFCREMEQILNWVIPIKFSLDFKCSYLVPESRIQNFEELHHHPLIFQERPSKFSCDLCSSTGGNGDEEDQSYSCSTCDFLIHKGCAYTTLAQRYKGHQHPLSVVHGIPEDLQLYQALNCDVCKSTVSPKDLLCHRARCRYFVHVRCMITREPDLVNSMKDAVDYLDDSFFKHLLKDDEFVIIHCPPRDISSELIQPFLLEKYGIVMNAHPSIHHFSHEKHEMILSQEMYVNSDSFFEEEDEEILCDACIQPISAPYYSCQECNYYLHLTCANLPSRIQHFSHPHEFKLVYTVKFYRSFKCNRCKRYCNGFGYWCESCNIYLDLACAAFPAIIMHETHEHPLFQMEAEDDGMCYGCGRISLNGSYIFKCLLCDVYLSYDCVMLSRSIRHRWDRQHPIHLRFPPHGDHPDHFMCDMCEELIHPKHWLYSCFQCDVSFHNRCAPRYQKYPNIKYGGKAQISSHSHNLKYLRKATLKIACDFCEGKLESFGVFECETCYSCICYKCGKLELS